MITKEQVLRSLFTPLGAIYPMPALKDGQAAQVAARCPEIITEEHLENLAVRIIETRKQKTFPSTQELINLVKTIRPSGLKESRPNPDLERMNEQDRKEDQALAMVRGTAMAAEACSDRWAPALIQFVAENERMPDGHERERLRSKSRANDVDARDFPGSIGYTIRGFRETMHETATRRLGDT